MEFHEIFKKTKPEPVSYGTAGYRTEHTIIKDIVRRAYLFCLIRSASVNRPVGLVLTASHNPSCDNGIKYIDFTGNMLSEENEELSDRIVNGSIESLLEEYKPYANKKSTVVISRDTRSSGREMVEWCKTASESLGEDHVLLDMGILTTPQSHFIIREVYKREIRNDSSEICTENLLRGMVEMYYKRIENMCRVVKRVFGDEAKQKRVLDSSNGVARDIFADIKKSVSSIVDISLLKNDKDLNEDCGSDFIKSKRELPAGISASTSESASEGKKLAISTENGSLDGSTFLCAFDGDADRMIYLKPSSNQLIDGDRLCVLFASFLNHLLSLSNVNSEITTVVTDYTNGAAVSELKTKGTVKVAGTGVKNMQKASNNAVTVWFESNGHGTACFSGEIYNEIKNKLGYSENICLLDMPESALLNEMDQLLCRPSTTLSTKDPSKRSPYNELFRKLTEQESLLLLHSLSDIFDPYIGDAIVNMLISECIFYSGFVLPDVLLGVYQDMPNLLTSVAGRRDRLNELLIQSIKANYSDARIHLRASGTEDIIRIYVEGECEEKLRSIVENIKITLSEL